MSTPVPALIVGAGPAGFAARLWLHDLKVPCVWMDRTGVVGGTLRRVGNPVHNWAGRSYASGIALADELADHAASLGLECMGGCEVMGVEPLEQGWEVRSTAGPFQASQVLLATGTRPRQLPLSGVAAWQGRGLEISVTRTRDRYRDRPVCVIGGGDAALEGALLLAAVTSTVHLVHRSNAFRGQPRFVDRVLQHPHISVHTGRQVSGLASSEPGGALESVQLDDGQRLRVDGVFVRIGVEPSIPVLGAEVARGPGGYLAPLRSGGLAPGLWCAGDVSDGEHQSAAWAAGQGARAAWGMAAALGYVSQAVRVGAPPGAVP